MKFFLVNVGKKSKVDFSTLGELYQHVKSKLGESNLNENLAAAHLAHYGNYHFKTAVNEYRIDLIMDPTDRFAFFIEGPDGVGKTHAIENLNFGVDLEFGHLCEFGEDPLCPGVEQTAKQITLQCMADHVNPMRDAMLTFADRYKNMRYYNDPSYQFFIVDRSWLTAVVYQGGNDVDVRAVIHVLGNDFTERLMRMGIMPIVILLRNPPYVTKSDDALDRNGEDVARAYVKASIMANDSGCIMLQSTSADVDFTIGSILRHHTKLLEVPKPEPVAKMPFIAKLTTYFK